MSINIRSPSESYSSSYSQSLSSSYSQSLSPSLSLTSSSDSFEDFFALNELQSNIRFINTQRKRKKKRNRKIKTITNTKRNLHCSKHRRSKKKTDATNNIIAPIRKYIHDEYNKHVRFSYSISHSSLKTSINIMVENLTGYNVFKIRMKWYKINNTTQTFKLAKQMEEYDYTRRVIHLYNDMDDYQYDDNNLIVKFKYRFIELDEWQEEQLIYYKSSKLCVDLK